jgi:hypothetical protein
MNRWLTVVLVVMLVLVGAMGLRNAMVAKASDAPIIVANGQGPVPPSPWMNGQGPVPPSPWMNGQGPVPPSPWKNGQGPVPPSPWKR